MRKIGNKRMRVYSDAQRAARASVMRVSMPAKSLVRELATTEEVSWGQSKIRRIGVPGGTQLNVRRATSFLLSWRGTAFKSALTSIAALVHLVVFAGLCIGAWYADRRLRPHSIDITVYVINAEIVEVSSVSI
jgi:hypothetical protein